MLTTLIFGFVFGVFIGFGIFCIIDSQEWW